MNLDPLSSDPVGPDADEDLPEVCILEYCLVYDTQHFLQLYDTAGGVFAAYGMLINRRLKSLVCLECKAVVLPQNVKPHLFKLHPGQKLRVDEDLIMATATAEGLSTSWPVLPSQGIPVQYAGLSCKIGVRCVACRNMSSKAKQMKKHAKQAHGITVDSTVPLRHSLMQRFANHPEAKSWFPVYGHSVTSPSSPHAQYLAELRKKLNERPALAAEEVDHRHISPWHTTTGWYSWLAGKYPEDIFPFSDYPKSTDTTWTNTIKRVQAFFNKAYKLPLLSSELSLQILNTEDKNGYVALHSPVLYADLCTGNSTIHHLVHIRWQTPGRHTVSFSQGLSSSCFVSLTLQVGMICLSCQTLWSTVWKSFA